jgi:hypothetical protein
MSREAGSAIARRRFLGLLATTPFVLQLSEAHDLLGFSSRKVKLQWEWTPGPGGPVDYFDVLVRTESGRYEGPAVRVPGTERTCIVTMPASKTGVYRIAIRAVNSSGVSAPSNELRFHAGVAPSVSADSRTEVI